MNRSRLKEVKFSFSLIKQGIYMKLVEARNKLVYENITKTYNKAYNEINMEAKNKAKKVEIEDRAECLAKKIIEASKIGRVSKKITERINKCINKIQDLINGKIPPM